MVENKRAMVVAVSQYDTSLVDLGFCENDGNSMHKVLTSNGYQIEEKNLLIGNVDGTKMRETILDFFNDITIRSNDIVLFYYSGHGVPDLDTVYLTSSDTDPNFPIKKGFSFDELRIMMDRCISTKVVTILDSCYSGAARLGKGPTDAAKLAQKLIGKGGGVQEEGQCILAASQSYQEAYGMNEGKGSVFTHYVVEGMKGDKDAADNSGNITPDTLGRYVYDKVTSEYPNQKPIRKVSTSGDIILAKIKPTKEKNKEKEFNQDGELKSGNTFFAADEYRQAISSYNLVLQNNPKNIDAWNNKGKVYEKLIMYEDALQCFNRAIEINSKDDVLWYNKGNILTKLNRYSDSLKCYESAINVNSKDPSYWKNKAYVLSKLGRNSEAKQCLTTANEI
jgi:hypothetical protein